MISGKNRNNRKGNAFSYGQTLVRPLRPPSDRHTCKFSSVELVKLKAINSETVIIVSFNKFVNEIHVLI